MLNVLRIAWLFNARRTCPVLVCLLSLLTAGCTSLSFKDGISLWPNDDERVIPDRVMPIWADAVLHQPGKPGVRGFGGRIYFYQGQESDPVKVSGSVTVYVFDGEAFGPEQAAPLKKYVVTPTQLDSHYSKTSLGHSYSLWVPWDQVGGASRTLSLIVRFDGVEGGTVLGEASTELLPGAASPAKSLGAIQRTGFEKPINGAAGSIDPVPGVTSHTIELPPSFQKRIAAQAGSAAKPTNTTEAGLGLAEGSHPADPVEKVPAARKQSVVNPSVNSLPSTGSRHSRYPAQTGLRVRPTGVPLRKSPHPARLPVGLPPTPRSGFPWKTGVSSSVDQPVEGQTELGVPGS